MPRIPDYMLHCVGYLYPDEETAQAGGPSGGSCVLVALQSEVEPDQGHFYVVTNRHVIEKARVLRLTSLDGRPLVHRTAAQDWVCHEGGDDLAVYYLDLPDGLARIVVITGDRFVQRCDLEDTKERAGIGIGDDVVLIGRFQGYDGLEMNEPSLRLGTISLIPRKPIRQDNGHDQESILVEARSLPGYSGSPVFVLEQHSLNSRTVLPAFDLKLLGIDWGHFPATQRVTTADGSEINITVNSGMMCVVPAWQISELLQNRSVKERREKEEAILRDKRNAEPRFESEFDRHMWRENRASSTRKG